jgi:hypothetical protein
MDGVRILSAHCLRGHESHSRGDNYLPFENLKVHFEL